VLSLALALCGLALPASADDVSGDDTGASGGRRQRPAAEAPKPAPAPAKPQAAADDCKWFPDFRCGRHGRWEGFEMPIDQPYLFEDPFITTGLVPVFIWHQFPVSSALGGGDLFVVALQARVAITDRLAFIATKDGYGWERPDRNILDDQEGWFNLAGGFKYALIQRPEDNFIMSAALRMEVGTGSSAIFEGQSGSVVFIPSLSAAWSYDKLHLIGDVGGQAGTDSDLHSSQFFFHAYADYTVHKHFQPFIQFSGQRYTGSGQGERSVRLKGGGSLPMETARQALGLDTFEGVDVHNLGNAGVNENFLAYFGVGAHIPINKHFTFSVAWSRPITDRSDIYRQRVTTALRMEF
jgi:hypothetical protein